MLQNPSLKKIKFESLEDIFRIHFPQHSQKGVCNEISQLKKHVPSP